MIKDFTEFFTVLYEDNHLIAVNKKNGVLVQGDETGDTPLSEHVKEYIKEKYQKPGNVFCGVIHRLDRPVSGLVLLAKTSKALERMNKLFHDKDIQKTYWAVVKNKPAEPSGKLVHWLTKYSKKNIAHAHSKEVKESKRCELYYRLIFSTDTYHLLEVKPITGRAHQIRCQLAAMGCPIKGDLKYGFPRSNENGGINLHAYQLEFDHPVTKEKIKITAPVPDEKFWGLFSEAGHGLR